MKPSELIKWRTEHGYTQEGIAHILGVAGNTIYRWEAGIREIPPFLHLALECIEKKGDELTQKGKEKGKEKGKHGKRHL